MALLGFLALGVKGSELGLSHLTLRVHVPFKGSVKDSFKGSFKGSIGFIGFVGFKKSMYPKSIYFGLKVVSIQALWGQCIYYLGTWIFRVKPMM